MKLYFTNILLFFVFLLNAQDNSSTYDKHIISFRAGYSIPISTSQIGSPRKEVGNTFYMKTGNKYSEKNTMGSRGTGLNLSLSYTYMITENISSELDFTFLQTLREIDATQLIQTDDLDTTYFAQQSSQTTMLRATPMIGIYADKNLLIRPYAKFGLLIPFFGITNTDLIIVDESSNSFNNLMPIIDLKTYNEIYSLMNNFGAILPVPTYTTIKAETEGAFSLGFDARLGAQYNIAKHMNIFLEMNLQVLNIEAKRTVIKKFNSTVNDVTLKELAIAKGIKTEFTESDIPDILRFTEYVTELTDKSNTSYDVAVAQELLKEFFPNAYEGLRDKPLEQLHFKNNNNAFGFMIGFKYGF